MVKPTAAMEDYLEALLVLEQKKIEPRVKNLANQLGIKPPSVIEMLKALVSKKFVTHVPRKDITLTATGRTIAVNVKQRHVSIKDFFHKVLGIDETLADADACKVEHCLSEETCGRLIEYMDDFNKGLPQPF